MAGSAFRDNTYTGKGVGNFIDVAVEVNAGADVTIIGNTISENLGTQSLNIKIKRENTKGKAKLSGLIPFSQSAGIHVTTEGGGGYRRCHR